jgi:hypothetical protein
MTRAIFAPGLSLAVVEELIHRLLSRLSRSRLEPFVRFGRTLRKYKHGILAARRLGINNARAEALNNKTTAQRVGRAFNDIAGLLVRRAYGFHSARAALALVLLTCGPIFPPATRATCQVTSPTIIHGEPYFLGLTWQYTRGSALIGWVGDDAAYIADQIETFHTNRPKRATGEAVGTR